MTRYLGSSARRGNDKIWKPVQFELAPSFQYLVHGNIYLPLSPYRGHLSPLSGFSLLVFITVSGIVFLNRKDPEGHMTKCTFDVKKTIDDVGRIRACDCAGATEIKGKGNLREETLSGISRGFKKGVKALASYGGILLDIVLLMLSPAHESSEGLGSDGESTGKVFLREESAQEPEIQKQPIPYFGEFVFDPCIKESFADAKKIHVNWNGLKSIKELEGLQSLVEITATHNNITEIPDLNTMPSLEKMDLQYNPIPKFYCNGQKFDKMQFNDREIKQIRDCQANRTRISQKTEK